MLARAVPCHRQVDPPSSCTPRPSRFFSLSLSLSFSQFSFLGGGFRVRRFSASQSSFAPGTTSLKSHSRSEDTTSLSMDDFKRYHLFEVTLNGTRRASRTVVSPRAPWRGSEITAKTAKSLRSAALIPACPTYVSASRENIDSFLVSTLAATTRTITGMKRQVFIRSSENTKWKLRRQSINEIYNPTPS